MIAQNFYLDLNFQVILTHRERNGKNENFRYLNC